MDNQSRLGFLGASDFGALLGLSRFKTPHQLWLEKTGQAECEPQNFNQELGHLLEPVVMTLFERRMGMVAMRKVNLAHPEIPWLRVQLDGSVACNAAGARGGGPYIVEAKHAAIKRDDGWGRDGTADVPGSYFAQVQVQMFTARANKWDVQLTFVPCLFLNGKTFNVFEVPYDHDMATAIVKRGEEFWNLVTTKTWPEREAA